MELINFLETYANGINKNSACKKEKILCNNIIKQCKNVWLLIIFQKKDIKKNNPNWPEILDCPYRKLIVGGLDLEKQMYCLI